MADRLEALDSQRAQFIRDQVLQNSSGNPTADLFEQSGPRWLQPLLAPLALDLSRLHLQHYSPSWRMCAQGHVTVRLWEEGGRQMAGLSPICWQRGFVSRLDLRPAPTMNLQQALRAEPIDQLHLAWNRHLQEGLWSRLTGPATGQIRQLSLDWKTGPAPDFSSLYEDPHWHSLVDLELGCWDNGLLPEPLPTAILARLSRSAWTAQLRLLRLYCPDCYGLDALFEQDWPQLQELEVTRIFSEGEVRGHPPALSRLPGSLRCLDFYDFEIGEEGLRQLAQATLPQLRQLRLSGAGFSRDALEILLQAPFLQGLESLDLSRNGLQMADFPEALHSRLRL